MSWLRPGGKRIKHFYPKFFMQFWVFILEIFETPGCIILALANEYKNILRRENSNGKTSCY
jgi:hypothetical protein